MEDDIAVIGVGLRFPGDADSPEGLWRVLEGGESQWSEFPKDRLNIEGYFHPGGDRQGSISFKGAHFLKNDVSTFDAPFFSVSVDDARAIDPQQRLLLEVSYEALESAGIRKEDVEGSDTAVYVGSFVKDYEQICLRDPDWQPQYAATGNGIAIMANRISYAFNFHGPSMTIDTGCSGSLVAIHLAAKSLRNGECSLALAAGAGLILTPNTIMPMTALNFLSPDGKCFTFDGRANGYGRGEGVGVVVLKRLSDALRDNDTIRAVIRGTRVNQDGRTPGITLPSKEAQVDNIRSLYTSVGLSFDQTAYVECHGTGTQAGDWRELKAVSETLARDRPIDQPIVVGSLKPNIGHLEGAAGVAGLIKGVLVLEHGKIPPNINFEHGNPSINFHEWKVKVPTRLMDWPLPGIRRVSVNCFGFGGTNAHVILEEAQGYLEAHGLTENSALTSVNHDQPHGVKCQATPRIFCFSSNEKAGVRRIIESHLKYLEGNKARLSTEFLASYSYTLCCRRSNLEWKHYVVADSADELLEKMNSQEMPRLRRSAIDKQSRICFAFCGQGSEWTKMEELLQYPSFEKSLRDASEYLENVLGSSFNLVGEILTPTESKLKPEIAQPATTAIQIAMVDLLQSLSIAPQHVIGHSSGEIAAAYAGGALTRQAAWEIAYFRGMAAARLSHSQGDTKGAMLATGMSFEEAQTYLGSSGWDVDIACINSPRSVTLSGESQAVYRVAKELKERGVFYRLLPVGVAYHSRQMKCVEEYYQILLKHITANPLRPDATMFSSVHGVRLQGPELDGLYWATNMVSPVQFQVAIRNMMGLPSEERPTIIVELSPQMSLKSPILDTLSDLSLKSPPAYFSIADRKLGFSRSVPQVAAEIWSRGHQIDMSPIITRGALPRCLSDLPPYSWNHSNSYWHESHLGEANRFRAYPRQDLIGAPTADSIPFEPRWRGFLRVSENPWIQDHQVQKTIVYPAAGMISMVLEGAKQISHGDENIRGYEISRMKIEKAMVIPTTKHGLEMALNIKMKPHLDGKGGQHSFSIYSKQLEAPWERHATGFLRCLHSSRPREASKCEVDDLERQRANCTNALVPRQLYEHMDTLGMNYGQLFQNIVEIHQGDGCCSSQVRIPDTKSKMPAAFEYPHLLHPATLDSMFQTLFAIEPIPMVPTFIDSIFVAADIGLGSSRDFFGFSTASRVGIGNARADITMRQRNSDSLVVVKGLQLTALENSSPGLESGGFLPNHRNLCTEIVWEKDATLATPRYLQDVLNFWAHKHPGLSILQVGASVSLTHAVLANLCPSGCVAPRLSRYTIGHIEGDQEVALDDEILPDKRAAPFIEYAKFSGSENLSVYHLILVVNKMGVDLDSLGSYLKPDGRILDISTFTSIDAVNSTDTETQDSGIDIPELGQIEAQPLQKPQGAGDILSHHVVFLHHDELDEQISNLIAIFSSNSMLETSSVSLSESVADPSILADKIVVSLLDLARNVDQACFTYNWTEPEFKMFHHMQKKAKGILWITQGAHMRPIHPKASPIVALARTLMSEDPLKIIVTLDLATGTNPGHEKICSLLSHILSCSFSQSSTSSLRETEFAEESGQLYIPRLAPVSNLNKIIEKSGNDAMISRIPFHPKPSTPEPGLKFIISRPGLVDGGAYFTRCPSQNLEANEVKIKFSSAFATHLDLEVAKGRTDKSNICMDMIGRVVSSGRQVAHVNPSDQVVALVADGALQNVLHVDSRFVTTHRPGLIPSCFVSAYYALVDIGRLGSGRTALIHGGASCFGLAAVQICHVMGVKVFVTVMGDGISSQRDALERGGLKPDHIIEANSDEFINSIMEKTGGRGVDVLYNPTQEHASINVRCVRRGGSIIQLEQVERCIARDILIRGTFVAFDLSQMMHDDIDDVARLFRLTMELIHGKPLDFMTSASSSAEFGIDRPMEALRHMGQAPYLGHATIIGDYNPSQRVPVLSEDISSRFRNAIDQDGTYLLVGGLGGLGRSISELLVANSARSLVFLSRSGASTDEAKRFINQLGQKGVRTSVFQVDICNRSAVAHTLQEITAGGAPPLRGVFQCAAVIKDAVFDNMTYSDWLSAFRPKAEGSWNLVKAVEASKQDPFFIFLASSAGVIGNRGQANYASGNCFEDALARHLRIRGKHAVSIDLGPVLGAGMLAEDEGILDALRASGFYGIRHEDFLQVLEHAITMEILPGQRMPAQVVLGVGTGGLMLQNQPADPYWSRTALYSYLNLVDMPPPDLSGGNAGLVMDIKSSLASCASVDAAVEIACTGLTGMLAKAMNMHLEEMDTGKPPNSYGVDSLVAVGVRNWILSNCGIQVSVFEILSERTIAELAMLVAEKGSFGERHGYTEEA
ncbi:unnamed protein product [Clonostachys chloroleuca]|uniref:Uncharacterized protein n=1 Tax=Clonostachys chloroleuca TaxID=1926264 RepID=A0AA35Q4S4_9HYPO|nr:unnamed protein product [Clonostachys chloroleuca]